MQISFGWLGVPIFFVLSGYLLGGKLEAVKMDRLELLYFFRNRFARIYPAVWVQISILVLVSLYVNGLVYDYDYYQLLMNALLLINLPPDFIKPMNGVWWTLPIELAFYMVLPFIVFFKRKMGGFFVFFVALLVTVLWRIYIFNKYSGDNYLVHLPILDALPGNIFAFVSGYYMSTWRVRFSDINKAVILCCTIFSIFAMQYWLDVVGDFYWNGSFLLVFWNSFVAFLLTVMLYLTLDPPRGFCWVKSKLFVYFGDISFGIYLWHLPILMCMGLLWPDVWRGVYGSLLALVVVMLSSVLAGHLSYRLVERPCIRYVKDLNLQLSKVG